MSLTDPTLLALGLGLTALVLAGLVSHARRRRRFAAYLGGRRALDRLSRQDLYGAGAGRMLLLGLAGVALSLAVAGPRWVETPPPPEPLTRVVLALDVSASMQAVDDGASSTNRLSVAVAAAEQLLDSLPEADVGLLLFAGSAYPLAPPTYDHEAIRFLLGGVSPTVASQYDPGTLMSAAVDSAVSLFERRPPDAPEVPARPEIRHLVFLSDGDAGSQDGALARALEIAVEAGVQVHTVGVGGEEAARVVLPRALYQQGGPVLDASGAPAMSRLDEAALRRIADAGEGHYARAGDAGGMNAFVTGLARPPLADVPEASAPTWTHYDLPSVLGLVALALVLLESFVGLRPLSWRRWARERAA